MRETIKFTHEPLEEDTLQSLASAEIQQNQVKLQDNLPPHQYARVDTVLRRLGGRYSPAKGIHIFQLYEPRPLVRAVLQEKRMPARNPFELFVTPPAFARQKLEGHASLFGGRKHANRRLPSRGCRVLDTCAGTGIWAEAFRALAEQHGLEEVVIHCCEDSELNQQILRAKGLEVVARDLLTWDADALPEEARYHCVLMNPPFQHCPRFVKAAWKLVKEGGMAYFLLSSGFTEVRPGGNKALYDLHTFILEHGTYEENPRNLFKRSGVSSVGSVMASLYKDEYAMHQPCNGYPSAYCDLALTLAHCNEPGYWTLREKLWNDFEAGRVSPAPQDPEVQARVRAFFARYIEQLRYKERTHIVLKEADYNAITAEILEEYRSEYRIPPSSSLEVSPHIGQAADWFYGLQQQSLF